MSVEVACPSCQKAYKVKAEAAGKKFRCKACQTVVTVPQAEAAEASFLDVDPWDAVDESAPPPPPPPRRTKSSSAGKPARRSSGDGMPVTVMVSIGICGVLMALNVLDVVFGIATDVGNKMRLGGPIVRLMVDFTIIKGLLERSDRIRRNSIMLDIIGLVCGTLCFGAILFGNQQAAANGLGIERDVVLIAIFVLNYVLWIVDLVMLTHSSARDYCDQ